MEHNQDFQRLFQKYINNECTPEEFEKLKTWIQRTEAADQLEGPMKSLWEQARASSAKENVDWAKMHARITRNEKPFLLRSSMLKYAAAISFLALGSYLYLHKVPQQQTSPQAATAYLSMHSGAKNATLIVLEDGTKVTLNANSDLRYPKTFGSATREVFLDGEAYFQVVHNTSKPFIVHSGKLKTQVLGTSFAVNAYSGTLPLSVSVLTGKVSVKDEKSNEQVVLTPGRVASTRKEHSKFLLSSLADPAESIAWIEDKMIFDNATLEETAFKLSNRFGVRIHITNKEVSQQRITAMFHKQPLHNILGALTRLTGSNYKSENTNYTIY
jgi:transmembrane sensor